MDISEVRKQYPQYSDMTDEQLARSLHGKFYSDMPYDQFTAKIGMQPAQPKKEQPTATWKDVPGIAAQFAANTVKNLTIPGMPRWGADYAMGAADPFIGGAQLATRAMPGTAASDAADALRAKAEAAYAATNPGDRFGSSAGRGAGQFLPMMPALKAIQPAASMIGRMAQGGAIGGVTAAFQPQDPNVPGGYGEAKTADILGGTVLGAAGVPVIEGAAGMAGKGANAVRGWFQKPNTTQAAVDQAVESTLKAAGLVEAQVPQDAMGRLRALAQQSLQAGKPVDPASAVRALNFSRLGVEPRASWVSRDPSQFALESNLEGVKNVGEGLASARSAANTQLATKLGEVSPRTGADAYGTGEKAIAALDKFNEGTQGVIRGAYTKAAELAGAKTEVPMQSLADAAGKVIEDFGVETLPASVTKRLQSYGLFGGNQTKSFTVKESESLRRLINNNTDPMNKPASAALRVIRDGLDDSLNRLADMGNTIGPEAAKAYAAARDLARQKFDLLKRVPALKAVYNGSALPDNFVDRYVLRGNAQQIEDMNILLGDRPDLLADMRAQVVDRLTKAAFGSSAPEAGSSFAQASYNNLLERIGDRRLGVLFKPSEIEQLKAIGAAARDIVKAPTGAPVNYSKTTPALLDLANRSGMLRRVPGVGWMARTAQEMGQQAQAQNALQPSIGGVVPPLISPDVLALWRHRLGVGGGGLLGAGFSAQQ